MIEAIVRNRAPVLLAVVCIVLFGSATYMALPREASPDVKVPVVMVTTPYVGVSPEDVESLITIPLENELAGLKDLEEMNSTSAEGISIIGLEFEPEIDIDEALQRVRDRSSRARPQLPEDAEETEVQEISFSDVPIMLVTIAGPADPQTLKKLGERLEDSVAQVPGVLDAKLSGGLTREIQIHVDPHRLSHYGLSLGDVIGAIGDENVNVPGGDVAAGDANFLLRVPGEFDEPLGIENVAVKRQGERPVFVRDIARVVDGFEERETYARMNGATAVTLGVTKRAGANILDIVDTVKKEVAEQSEQWPEGVEYRVLADQSEQIRDMVANLENNVITAFLLVIAVVLLFMGFRNSVFVGISIPLSMLLSFIFISLFGMTLNMMVLFSLVLALGMLVDNAIVLVENIYRHMEEGSPPVRASIEATKEVGGAVAASTATTVAAFVPLVFWTGIMGEFMGYLPKTVIIVLISSLVVAVGILPVFTAGFMRAKHRQESSSPAEEPGAMLRWYRRVLDTSIRYRYLSALVGLVSLIGTVMAYGALNHGTEFFPATEPNRATVSVAAPDGTALEATDRLARKVETILSDFENVDVFVAETGISGSGNPLKGERASSNNARLTVDFLPHSSNAKPGEKTRVENTSRTIDRIRERISRIPGATITIEEERMGPPVGPPVAVEVSGDDFHQVGELAAKVRRDLRTIEGVTDIEDDYKVGRPEMRLRVDRGAAKRVGASTDAIARTVRTAVAGTKASTLRDGEDEYDIVVELDPRYRDNLQSVLNLRIPGKKDTSPDTFPVPLSSVASYELAGGTGAIKHVDQDLVVTIEGEIAKGYNENAVRADVQKYIAGKSLPAGFHMRLGGANDEQRNAQEFLSRAFLIALFLILFVLVVQFNRFDLPLLVLATVVLSMIGVLWGLIITGTAFGVIMTGLGVISLAGVVVNNAIVLLTYVEQLRERGMNVRDALVRAGMTRFRPVMLTAITTILGLVPMAIGVSIDFRNLRLAWGGQNAQFWGPMAIAVIFGLAFATVLTLVMVPTFYSIFEDIRLRLRRKVEDPVGTAGAEAGS